MKNSLNFANTCLKVVDTRRKGEVPMRVAIYARVSTANNGQDPTMQTRELREYCERRG